MNPSATGWIKKLIKVLNPSQTLANTSIDNYYEAFRNCGFIYGSNVEIVAKLIENKDFETEEICKINLIIALLIVHENSTSKNDFFTDVNQFYNTLNEKKTSFIEILLGSGSKEDKVERLINKRVQIDDNLLNKSFNYFITNALLFIDVLAFKNYLNDLKITDDFLKNHEIIIESIVINTLNSKQNKTDYDKNLIDLFEQSARYEHEKVLSFDDAISKIETEIFARYCLDLAAMATWTDATLDKSEANFLAQLGKQLNLNELHVNQAENSIAEFYVKYKEDVPLLGSKNIVKTFYDNSSNFVLKLIRRNGKRLTKELTESKELVLLLSQSTIRELNKEEQKKVQEQLLDIFKSIPSLAIFLLPGGALLLPLVVKFIPKLLPSAFDDNRIEDEEKKE